MDKVIVKNKVMHFLTHIVYFSLASNGLAEVVTASANYYCYSWERLLYRSTWNIFSIF